MVALFCSIAFAAFIIPALNPNISHNDIYCVLTNMTRILCNLSCLLFYRAYHALLYTLLF